MGINLLKPKTFTKGLVVSETNFFTVIDSNNSDVFLSDTSGNKITVSKQYAEKMLYDADSYNEVKQLTQTELIEIVKSNPFVAMSIGFIKSDKPKTKKLILEEKQEAINKILSKSLTIPLKELLEEAININISEVVPGDNRIIKGYYVGSQDDRGRFQFKDMEDKEIIKGVDSRTIYEVIVKGVKYTKK